MKGPDDQQIASAKMVIMDESSYFGPTGRKKFIDGDEFAEIYHKSRYEWIPVEPDVVYGRTGEWKGWCHFLGSNDFETVTEGMSREKKAEEWDLYCLHVRE